MNAALIVLLIVGIVIVFSVLALVVAQAMHHGLRESEWPDA